MRRIIHVAIVSIVVFLIGCAEPIPDHRLDGSTPETMAESTKKMKEDLSKDQQTMYEYAVLTIMNEKFNKKNDKMTDDNFHQRMEEYGKLVHGKNYTEILEMAIRLKHESGKD